MEGVDTMIPERGYLAVSFFSMGGGRLYTILQREAVSAMEESLTKYLPLSAVKIDSWLGLSP